MIINYVIKKKSTYLDLHLQTKNDSYVYQPFVDYTMYKNLNALLNILKWIHITEDYLNFLTYGCKSKQIYDVFKPKFK